MGRIPIALVISFHKNIKNIFLQEFIYIMNIAGMDLGNAALSYRFAFKDEYDMDRSYEWVLCFQYIPKRLVGENIQTSLKPPFR